jgi:hypothetical protein
MEGKMKQIDLQGGPMCGLDGESIDINHMEVTYTHKKDGMRIIYRFDHYRDDGVEVFRFHGKLPARKQWQKIPRKSSK